MPGQGFELYASHAAELVERVADESPLELATNAEVLLALSAQSLKAPLNRDGQLAMESLFARIFPDRVETPPPPESYAGHLDELLNELRRRLIVKTRRGLLSKARDAKHSDAA